MAEDKHPVPGKDIVKTPDGFMPYKPDPSEIEIPKKTENTGSGGTNSSGEVSSTQSSLPDIDSAKATINSEYPKNWYMITLFNVSFNPPRKISFYGHVPDDFSESHGTEFDTVHIKSRSNPLASYGGSGGKTLSLTLELHEDYIDTFETGGACTTNIVEYVAKIRAMTYPKYVGTLVVPPRVYIMIGNQVRMKGYCTTCTVNWKKPVRNGHYISCTVTFEIIETLSISFSAEEVYDSKDLARYAWYHETSGDHGGSFNVGPDVVKEEIAEKVTGGVPVLGTSSPAPGVNNVITGPYAAAPAKAATEAVAKVGQAGKAAQAAVDKATAFQKKLAKIKESIQKPKFLEQMKDVIAKVKNAKETIDSAKATIESVKTAADEIKRSIDAIKDAKGLSGAVAAVEGLGNAIDKAVDTIGNVAQIPAKLEQAAEIFKTSGEVTRAGNGTAEQWQAATAAANAAAMAGQAASTAKDAISGVTTAAREAKKQAERRAQQAERAKHIGG